MPESINPRGKDNPSQYVIEDRNNEAEMVRLMIQDQTATAGMGGPLAEQADPARLHRVLDIGCGPGGWALEAAALYPQMEVVGIDISWRMIEYARAQARARQLADRVTFVVMDALGPLDFADGSFDLVNLRFGLSFLLVKDWPRVLTEFLRVTRAGGIIRITDGDMWRTSSPACNRIAQMTLCALYRSGHSLTPEHGGVTSELDRLLAEARCEQVQSKDYTFELAAGTVGAQYFYQDMMYGFQTGKPFLQKTGCAPEDYDAICEQALLEMQQPDFRVTWPLLTVWGTKRADQAASLGPSEETLPQ
jgi:ubiquinone/menaquinone biosynthesis C-methylase UbiE